MSALGDYLHLHAKSYLEHGTTRSGDDNFEGVLNKQKEIMQRRIQKIPVKKDIQEFQTNLQSFIDSIKNLKKSKIEKKNMDDTEKFLNQITEIIEQNTIGKKEEISVDYEHLKMLGNNIMIGKIKLKKLKDNEDYFNNVKTRIDNFKNLLDNNFFKKEDMDDLRELNKGLSKLAAEVGYDDNETNNQLIKEFNKIVDKYQLYQGLAKLQGDLLEYLIKAFELNLKSAEEKAKENFLKNNLKVEGGERSPIEYKNIKGVLKGGQVEAIIKSSGLKSSQQKVDVEISYNDDNLNISAKNLTIGEGIKQIHLLSGSKLYYLLQNEHPDFVNHYLSVYLNYDDRKNYSQQLKDRENQLLPILLFTLFFKGLTGKVYGRNSIADVLVVHDTVTGKIKCLSMRQILFYVYSKVLDGKMDNNLIAGHKEDIVKLYDNTKEGSEEQRLDKIIAEMNNRIINVTMNSSVLGKLK